MVDENYMPKTVREQLFYIIGMLNSMDQDENGCINVNHNMIIEQLTIATKIGYENNLPKITYRDVELPKGTLVTSTDYPPKSVNHCSDSF